MVDTLKDVRQQWPNRPVHLMVGQDAVNRLDSWHQWLELFELANIVILTRPSADVAYTQELSDQIGKRRLEDITVFNSSTAGAVLPLQVGAVDVSATMIKSIIRLGRPPKGMLPPEVWSFIEENRLYQHHKEAAQTAETTTD